MSSSEISKPGSLWFPYAAQADIVRAAQKDHLCLATLENSLLDVVQNFMGPSAVMQHRDCLHALASAIYHGSSTGAGQQTLGEEYCDLLQVSASKLHPSTLSRTAQTLMHSLLPLLQAKLASLPLETPEQLPDSPTSKPRAREPPPPSSSSPSAMSLDTLSSPTPPTSPAHQAADDVPGGQTSARGRVLSRFARRYWWLATTAAHWLPLVSQLHLALFYVLGSFYDAPRRLSGTRLLYIGASHANRRYYGVMGMLLLVQFAVRFWREIRPEDEHVNEEARASPTDQKALIIHPPLAPAFDGPPPRQPQSPSERTTTGRALQQPADERLRCSLCLSERMVPTTTPCGHVFCWTCIVPWCQRKAECPICRRASHVQDLVPIAHAAY